jgi:hypothetical protein
MVSRNRAMVYVGDGSLELSAMSADKEQPGAFLSYAG